MLPQDFRGEMGLENIQTYQERHGMKLKTILNCVEPFKSFVYGNVG
jgi:hypothetical protein